VSDRLRHLWDCSDLDATSETLDEQLTRETDDAGRAEVLTQLARIEGLRNDFAAASRHLAEAEGLAGSSVVARARIDLERGRALRSSGEPAAAFPLLVSAYELALGSGNDFIAADAVHMAALVDPLGAEPWSARGIDLAGRSAAVAYWLGPLYNNLGWARLEAADAAGAHDAFEIRGCRPGGARRLLGRGERHPRRLVLRRAGRGLRGTLPRRGRAPGCPPRNPAPRVSRPVVRRGSRGAAGGAPVAARAPNSSLAEVTIRLT
jgi:hypothetical protein